MQVSVKFLESEYQLGTVNGINYNVVVPEV